MHIQVEIEKSHKNDGNLNANLSHVIDRLFIKNDEKTKAYLKKILMLNVLSKFFLMISLILLLIKIFTSQNIMFIVIMTFLIFIASHYLSHNCNQAFSEIYKSKNYSDFVNNHFSKVVSIEGQGKVKEVNAYNGKHLAIVADEDTYFDVKLNSLEGSKMKGYDSRKILNDLRSNFFIIDSDTQFKVGDTLKFVSNDNGLDIDSVDDQDANDKENAKEEK